MRTFLSTLIAGLFVSAGLAHAETLEEVEKKISEQMAKHKTVQVKSKSKSDYAMEGASMKMQAESTAMYARKGDKWVSRNESKISTSRKSPQEGEVQEDAKVLMVSDGDYVYTLNEASGNKTAMKMKNTGSDMNPFNNKELWKEMHKHFDMKLLAAEKIDGKAVWVIESRPKKDKDQAAAPPQPMTDMVSTTYYRQDDGIVQRLVTRDKSGKIVQQTDTVDVKLNAELSPDLFKFKAPEGVQVMDMEALQGGGGGVAQQPGSSENAGSPSPTPPAEEKPAQQPAAQEQPKPQKKGVGGLLNKLKR